MEKRLRALDLALDTFQISYVILYRFPGFVIE